MVFQYVTERYVGWKCGVGDEARGQRVQLKKKLQTGSSSDFICIKTALIWK